MISTEFLTAGRAIFTVSNGRGDHYTFKLGRIRDNDSTLKAFVLKGSDNTRDYDFLCLVKAADLTLFKPVKRKAVRVLAWALDVAKGIKSLPPGYTLEHAGRCGKCGRLLTEPESLKTGIGPACRKTNNDR